MKYLGLASVVVLTLSLGMFIPQAGANTNTPKEEALALKLQKQEALALKKEEAHALKLQKQEALALNKQEALERKHSGNLVGPNSSGNHVGSNSNSSVPEPGALLLLGGAFAGLVWWRERQRRA